MHPETHCKGAGKVNVKQGLWDIKLDKVGVESKSGVSDGSISAVCMSHHLMRGKYRKHTSHL